MNQSKDHEVISSRTNFDACALESADSHPVSPCCLRRAPSFLRRVSVSWDGTGHEYFLAASTNESNARASALLSSVSPLLSSEGHSVPFACASLASASIRLRFCFVALISLTISRKPTSINGAYTGSASRYARRRMK